jgi:putative transposase
MSKTMRTIVLKIYKPSKIKRAIIDEAMFNYSKAFQYMLDKASNQIDAINESSRDKMGRYSANLILRWIDKDMMKELNKFSVEPFKDSLRIDFASALAGYLSLKAKGIKANYPQTFISEDESEEEYDKLLKNLTENTGHLSYIENEINKLINKSGKPRPLYFCRYSKIRNFCLLYNPDEDKYYAKVYLMNVKNEKRRESNISEGKKLIYISDDKELYKENCSRKRYLLLPLSFGRWQEAYLKKAFEKPDMIKTARLTKKKDRYFLSINMEMSECSNMEYENYMGVSRGVRNAVNYSAVDKEGRLLFEGYLELSDQESKSDIHKLANKLIIIAQENKCQIIMEKLIRIGDGLKEPSLNYKNYNELYKIIKYKSKENALSEPIRVSGFGLFNTCPRCGTNSKTNWFSNRLLICTHCGMTMDIDSTGSLNLARKLIKYNKDAIKIITVSSPEGIKFVNDDIGFEYCPGNPYDCEEEFREKISSLIKSFYDNIEMESKKSGFMKKYSMIKKLEEHEDLFEVIKIE